jgi:hypothetical protein
MPSSISRIDSHGKRLLPRTVAGSASFTISFSTSRDFGPAMAKTPHCVVTSWISTQPPPAPMKSSADFIRKSAS